MQRHARRPWPRSPRADGANDLSGRADVIPSFKVVPGDRQSRNGPGSLRTRASQHQPSGLVSPRGSFGEGIELVALPQTQPESYVVCRLDLHAITLSLLRPRKLLPQRIYDGLGNVSHFGQPSRPLRIEPRGFAVTEDLHGRDRVLMGRQGMASINAGHMPPPLHQTHLRRAVIAIFASAVNIMYENGRASDGLIQTAGIDSTRCSRQPQAFRFLHLLLDTPTQCLATGMSRPAPAAPMEQKKSPASSEASSRPSLTQVWPGPF
jgi:hypothetical protein